MREHWHYSTPNDRKLSHFCLQKGGERGGSLPAAPSDRWPPLRPANTTTCCAPSSYGAFAGGASASSSSTSTSSALTNTKNVSKHAPHVPRPHLAQPLPARASSSFVGCGLRTSESTRSHDHARRRISLVLSSQGNISCPQQGLTRAGRSTAAPTSQLNARPTRRRPHGMRTFKGRVT